MVKILNHNNIDVIITAKLADTFFSKFLGLMFRKSLPEDTGIILVEKEESKINTSIHMLFMNFDIGVLWLTKDLVVCDMQHANKWKLAYFPKKRAQYVIEIHASKLSEYSIGDQLEFTYEK